MKFRLISATISGIKSIDRAITIDFLNQYPSYKDLSSAHIKAIYGPNGSGKTGIITAFHIYKSLLTRVDSLSDSSIPFNYLINAKTKKLDMTTTFVVLRGNKKEYRHHIVVDFSRPPYRIVEERFVSLGKRKEEKVLLDFNENNKVLEVVGYKEYAQSILGRLTGSLATSIIYKIRENNDRKSFNKLMMYADLLFLGMNIEVFYGESSDSPLLLNTLGEDDLSFLDRITYTQQETNIKKISNFDYIVEIKDKKEYEEKLATLTSMVKLMKPNLERIRPTYQPINKYIEGVYLSMVYDNGDLVVPIAYESTGVRKIARLFDSINLANKGSIVFIDEIDADIHDVFLCNLLDYFARYTDCQLVLTTHNVDIMNNVLSLKHSIDFISQDNVYTSWVKNGTSSPKNAYLKGMVSHIPFNLISSDFISVFEGDKNE